MEILSVQAVDFTRQGETILKDINWKINEGEHWALIGPNGSGKSTLPSIMTANDWPSRGRVRVLGETYGRINLRDFRQRLGVFQPALHASLNVYHPRLTALDVICTGSDGSLAVYHEYSPSVKARAMTLFKRYLQGQGGRESFPPERAFAKLSSGERRKVLLLRMLMAGPELLFLDEPYDSLDIPSRLELEEMLNDYVVENRPHTIFIVHRIEEIPAFCSHALLIKDGRVFRSGKLEEIVTSQNLSELYQIPLHVGRKSGIFYWIPEGKVTTG